MEVKKFTRTELLREDFVQELLTVVTLLLQSNSQEVAKSVLGFVKVSVVVLPKTSVSTSLPSLVSI